MVDGGPSRRGEGISGELELATLHPTARTESASDLFRHAEIGGRFVAKLNPRRTVRLANELRQRLAVEARHGA